MVLARLEGPPQPLRYRFECDAGCVSEMTPHRIWINPEFCSTLYRITCQDSGGQRRRDAASAERSSSALNPGLLSARVTGEA